MNILDGKLVSRNILNNLKIRLNKLDKRLGFAVIQVGNDEASSIYVKNKKKMALELGCWFNYIKFDSDVSQEMILETIDRLNNDTRVDGILVQLPLPTKLDKGSILNRIVYYKDIDGLTDINISKLINGEDGLVPCTALGIMDLLKYYNINIKGANVVIVGRSQLVGKPVYHLLVREGAMVTVCHSKTKNLSDITKEADILIVAIGKARFIRREMLKKGVVIVDAGINRVDNKIYGDVDFEDVKDIVSFITPIPGGIGPITVAELGCNIYKAYYLKSTNVD